MIIADPDATVDYVLKSERKRTESNKTVWELRPLTARQFIAIQSVLPKNGEKPTTEDNFNAAFMAIQNGLVGWRNLRSKSGNEVPYNEKTKELLKLEVIGELGNRIIELSTMSEDDAKN